ncbi:RraA family protein [Piscinibacter sakaiensis]|uniref:Putative 4-hydroxy-4-methyl-2-oxoglutarate aldolase n=1 Tax=Piscinibacter sakaiensis TaxID=1547922 RepID=A0A0K8NVL5_PISS1|nr:RraA family protein [Piscinibacter sakaiensis]GAP34436.1 dimethylmenaquinone methyltransferase family protein [Piscinibacter sakaiensis]
MSNVGFRIFKRIHRPSPELVRGFQGIPVANIADEMGRMFCMDTGLRPLNTTPMLGTAFTVRARPGCNLMLHRAIDMAEPGDVIVVEDQGDQANALTGENMMMWAARRGVAGVVIDGAVRDRASIGGLAFPVYSRGITPRGPHKNGPGEINVPISCGGVVVHPGDIVVGDEDGVLVIAPRDAEAVLRKARGKLAKEIATRQAIEAGTWDRSGYTEEVLAAMGCEVIDAAYADVEGAR